MPRGIGDPLEAARAYFRAEGSPAYVVGGRVRDALLGRPTIDTDVAVPSGAGAHARAIARAFGGAFVDLDPERDIARVAWADAALDVSRFVGPSLETDLRARDFTVNAMAVALGDDLPPAPGRLHDPTGGRADLVARLLRMTAPAALEADPLRLLRAVRLGCELSFGIEPATREAVRARAAMAARPAPERRRDELLRILAADPVGGTRDLDALGLLEAVLPELAACRGISLGPERAEDVLGHTQSVLERLEEVRTALLGGRPTGIPSALLAPLAEHADGLRAHFATDVGPTGRWPALFLAAALHDAGKARARAGEEPGRGSFPDHAHHGADVAETAAGRLRLSRAERAYLARVVGGHPRPLALGRSGGPSRRDVYRYFLDLGAAGVDVVVLSVADNAAKPVRASGWDALADTLAALLRAWFVERAEWVDPPPLVSGDEVAAALDLEPGPAIGRILAGLREAQAVGEVSDRAAALDLAARLQAEGGA